MAASNKAKIKALLPSLIASVVPPLKTLIRALLRPVLAAPFRPVWACPDEDGTVEWFGDGAEELLELQLLQTNNEEEVTSNMENNHMSKDREEDAFEYFTSNSNVDTNNSW
jgi:hypothetical protein